MGMLISNEPDFMIHGVLQYQMFGQEFWITTTTIGMWILSIIILIIAVLANRTLKRAADVPGTFQNALEYAYEMLEKMGEGILGGNTRRIHQLHRDNLLIYSFLQSEWSLGAPCTNS